MKLPPSYLKLYRTGELKKRIETAYALMGKCTICPRKCAVNRLKNERGICGIGLLPLVSSFNAHFGEEPPISGHSGSGTIFFTRCNLKCVYCQNYPISQLGHGEEVTIQRLAEIMLSLQKDKCHNINLVTPTHVVPQILAALLIASEKGLNIPLVYNSGGYESQETLKLLDGVIDIYLPDAKYSNNGSSLKYSGAGNYVEVNKKTLLEMHRQVGDLVMDEEGIAQRGLLIRHLVLPENISGSKEVLTFIARKISPNTYMSLMAQYHPAHRANDYPELSRRVVLEEYAAVLKIARRLGLDRGWKQIL
jgi:putative pyruvate formate lyase activating enzyme